MPNKMFSGWLRVKLPAEHLAKQGLDVLVTDTEHSSADLVWYQEFRDPKTFDPKKKYVLEFDDIMDYTGVAAPPYFYENIEKADYVIVGNEYMVNRYKQYNKNMVAITDYIDPCTRKAVNKKKDDGILRVGWMGSEMYSSEAEQFRNVFQNIHDKYPFVRFYLIGFGRNLVNDYIQHVPYVRYEHFNDVFASLGIDIGMTYLSYREISMAKTQLKVAEYAWLGIPSIASKTIYGDTKFAKKGHCLIADEIEDYEEKLDSLIDDVDKAMTLGVNAENFAKENYDLHTHLGEWRKVFDKVKKS